MPDIEVPPGTIDLTGGASNFLGLNDTPTSYAGQAGLYIRVNATEDGLEFASETGLGDVVGPASATSQSLAWYTDTSGKAIGTDPVILRNAGVGLQIYRQGVNSTSLQFLDAVGALNGVVESTTDNELIVSGVDLLTLETSNSGNVQLNPAAGFVELYSGAYRMPQTIGAAGQHLTVPASGNLLEWDNVITSNLSTADQTIPDGVSRQILGEQSSGLVINFVDTNFGSYLNQLYAEFSPTLLCLAREDGSGTGSSTGAHLLEFTPTAATFTDSINSRGLEYAADYSANFTARTLVDREYVDAVEISRPGTTTLNAIPTWGDTTGDSLLNTDLTLTLNGGTGNYDFTAATGIDMRPTGQFGVIATTIDLTASSTAQLVSTSGNTLVQSANNVQVFADNNVLIEHGDGGSDAVLVRPATSGGNARLEIGRGNSAILEANETTDDVQLTSGADLDFVVTGTIGFYNQYRFPNEAGTPGFVLAYPASGNLLEWVDPEGGLFLPTAGGTMTGDIQFSDGVALTGAVSPGTHQLVTYDDTGSQAIFGNSALTTTIRSAARVEVESDLDMNGNDLFNLDQATFSTGSSQISFAGATSGINWTTSGGFITNPDVISLRASTSYIDLVSGDIRTDLGASTYTVFDTVGAVLTYGDATTAANILGTSISMYGAYSFPTSIGTSGQVLTVPGSGTDLEWTTVSSGGQVDTIVAGTNISVDATDPVNPTVSAPDVLPLAGGTLTGNLIMGANQIRFDANDTGNGIRDDSGALWLGEAATGELRLNINSRPMIIRGSTIELYNNYVMPPDPGTAGQVITWPASGTELEWTTVASGGGQVDSVVAGTNISVDDTDPVNPIVSAVNLLPLSGGTMTGNIAMQGNDITFTGGGTILQGDADALLSYTTNGGVALHYNNVATIETLVDGIEVTGQQITVDEPSADPALVNIRNNEGGTQIVSDGKTTSIYQTNANSVIEDIWLFMDTNAGVTAYHNNISQLLTQGIAASGNTTGAQVKHHDGAFYDVGMNVSPALVSTSALALTDIHVGKTIVKTVPSQIDITTGDTNIAPDGSQWNVLNVSGSTIVIDANTGITLIRADGSGALADQVMADDSVCTIWKRSDSLYYIWGTGLS